MFLPLGNRQKKKFQKRTMLDYLSSMDESGGKNIEFPLISFEKIVAATDNFSNSNMLGQGGFGKVYKVLVKSFTFKITLLSIKIPILNDDIVGNVGRH